MCDANSSANVVVAQKKRQVQRVLAQLTQNDGHGAKRSSTEEQRVYTPRAPLALHSTNSACSADSYRHACAVIE